MLVSAGVFWRNNAAGGFDTPVLGVDGGATKTVCVVADGEFRVLGAGLAGPSNYHVVGVEEARKNVDLAVRQAVPTNLRSKIDICCFGMSGLNTKQDREVISGFVKPLVKTGKYIFVNDVVVAFYAATCGEPGIVVVAGTGSIAYGEYRLGGQRVIVRNGVCRIKSGSLAGSTLTINTAVRNTMEATGLPLRTVVKMATVNPARIVGVWERKGSIEPGKNADITIIDDRVNVYTTIVRGKIVFQAPQI
ncbi:MAG: BadF/BadG/BcrA/BcrD ATPase family protein [Candidatus Freyrarchaeum guaymaensis]